VGGSSYNSEEFLHTFDYAAHACHIFASSGTILAPVLAATVSDGAF
jgi:hypothetical protein